MGGPAALQLPEGRAFVMANDPQNIMVVQTAQVHKCIERLLKEMRASMRIQIQVDVRFASSGSEVVFENNKVLGSTSSPTHDRARTLTRDRHVQG